MRPWPSKHPVAKLLALVVVAPALLAACDGGGGPNATGDCPPSRQARNVSLIPKTIALADFGTVTRVQKDGKFIVATARSEESIPDLFPRALNSLKEEHSILSRDNEGFEAEIFFADAEGRTGLIQMREGPCQGQITLRLTFG